MKVNMSLSFSSDASEVLARDLNIKSVALKPVETNKLDEAYEITRCIDWIRSNCYTKVALQFPDSQLVDSVEVALKLEESTQAEIFILGDVTYGSCCVDFISAEHAGADCLVHFGPSCLSALPASSIPVLFIFTHSEINCQHVLDLVMASEELVIAQCLLLLYEVSYAQVARVLGEKLKEVHKNVVVSDIQIPGQNCAPPVDACIRCHRLLHLTNDISLSQCSVLYIGQENLTQYNMIMNFSQCPFFTYNPSTGKLLKDSIDVNRTLKRRFYIVERLKDAQIIGILIGTLGVDKYLPVVDHLKALIKERKKRSYILAVGKPNVPKLANFPEIDAFVLVACEENSLLDSKDYLAPIATPFELELALNPSRNFQDGQYVTDYSQLLPGGENHVPVSDMPEDGDVSLVTGKIRSFDIESLKEDLSISGSSVIIRNGMALATLHARGGGEHLSQRSWKGLEQQLGITPVTTATEGLSGIAASYEGEGQE